MKKLLIISLILTSVTASAKNYRNFDARLKTLESKIEKYSSFRNSPLSKVFETAKISGRLHIDSKFYDENITLGDKKQDGIDIKEARLSIEGKLSKDFSYKFENDFANNASKIKDAYISYFGIKNVTLKLGQFKQPFSLEELISSNHTTFLDRSIAVGDAPSRFVGFQGSIMGKNWSVTSGLFGESSGNESRTDDSEYSYSARISYAPINSNGNLIHLGIASVITSKDRNSSNPGVNITANDIDKEKLYGAELALGFKSLSLQSEYIINDTNYDSDAKGTGAKNTTGKKANYHSHYIMLSYILTGENRFYCSKASIFKGVKVKNPVNKGGIGAWELAIRTSKHDKNDDDGKISIVNGNISQKSFGVNWYLNNNMRIMANYVISKTDKRLSTKERYDALLVRVQANF